MIGKSITPWRVVAIYLALGACLLRRLCHCRGWDKRSGFDLHVWGVPIPSPLRVRTLQPRIGRPSDAVRALAEVRREELAAGRFPWSNPYQGGGLPFVGNHQSALFYPTTWLFLVLPDNLASVLTALAKVTAAAAGTFVFLRSFAILRWVALLVLFS